MTQHSAAATHHQAGSTPRPSPKRVIRPATLKGDQQPDGFSTAYGYDTPVATNDLGGMYREGQGVPQDNLHAYMWVNIAASNGDEDGGKLRDGVAKEMTATQIEKAQELARECIRKKYKGC